MPVLGHAEVVEELQVRQLLDEQGEVGIEFVLLEHVHVAWVPGEVEDAEVLLGEEVVQLLLEGVGSEVEEVVHHGQRLDVVGQLGEGGLGEEVVVEDQARIGVGRGREYFSAEMRLE